MNVRYRVELSQSERAELTALLSGGKHAARKLKRAQILLAAECRRQRRGDCEERRGGRLHRVPNKAPLRARQSGGGAQRGAAPGGDAASSPAKRKPCWSQPPVRAHPPGVRVGRWSFWQVNWSGSPNMPASRGKPCAGAWPKTT